MELAARGVRSTRYFIETIAPVETEHAEHREIYSHAETGRTIQVERVELVETEPAVTGLHKCEGINHCRRVKSERITQLHGIFREDVTTLIAIQRISRCQRSVGITSHADELSSIEVIRAREAVAAETETLERSDADVRVIIAKEAETGACHDDQLVVDLSVEGGLELPLVELDPVEFGVFALIDVGVFLLVIDRMKYRIRRSKLE